MDQDGLEGMEALAPEECQRLLRAGGVGILALSGIDAPVLRPVNFALHETPSTDWILIRTGAGQILEAAGGVEPASFVISAADSLEHTGSSVIVTGRLAEHSSVGEVGDVPLRPWVRADKHHFVGLSIDRISGRRLTDGTRGA